MGIFPILGIRCLVLYLGRTTYCKETSDGICHNPYLTVFFVVKLSDIIYINRIELYGLWLSREYDYAA